MFELNGYQMPDFPESRYPYAMASLDSSGGCAYLTFAESRYPYAMISLDSSGGCAYLTFADKAGYIKKLIAGDVWTGNAYTLGLTPEDTYDESKVIYEQSYVVMLDEAYKDALELLYPGITTTAWLRYTPPSTQTPSGGYYSLAMNYGPQWTNTDLYDEDGNLFLSAAGKKFPLREWLSWRIYGLCSRPLPMGAREPVAYLYNEISAPKLPARDEEKYPHLLMYETYFLQTGTTRVYYLSEPFVIEDRDGELYLRRNDGTPFDVVYCYYNKYGDIAAWSSEVKQTAQTEIEIPKSGLPPYWANYDVMDANGELWLAASEPIPVYE